MSDDPGRYEDRITCFCGHGLSNHDDYGPCDQCSCFYWHGCLVIVGSAEQGDDEQAWWDRTHTWGP